MAAKTREYWTPCKHPHCIHFISQNKEQVVLYHKACRKEGRRLNYKKEKNNENNA